MEKLITQYSSQIAYRGREASSDLEDGQAERLSQTAKSRQRLAIHSLVRQADFVDNSGDIASPSSTLDIRSSTSPYGDPRNAPSIPEHTAALEGIRSSGTVDLANTIEDALNAPQPAPRRPDGGADDYWPA
jgi:hypothetical protein